MVTAGSWQTRLTPARRGGRLDGRGRAEKYSDRPVHIIVNRGNPRTRNEAAARAEIVNAYRGGSCRLSLRSDPPCGHNAAQRVASLRTRLVLPSLRAKRSNPSTPRKKRMDCVVAGAPLHKRFAFVAGNEAFKAFVPGVRAQPSRCFTPRSVQTSDPASFSTTLPHRGKDIERR